MALRDVTEGHRYLTATSKTKTPCASVGRRGAGQEAETQHFQESYVERLWAALFSDLKSHLDNYACRAGQYDQ